MILICTSYLSLPKSALNLTRFNFNIAIGYVTLVSVVTNIRLDLLSANLLHIDVWCLLLHLHKRQNALNLPVLFFFLFLCQPYPGLRNYKLVFLILKILQYDRLRRWVQLFPRYPCKKWYLLFYKSYDHRIWLAGTSTGFDSSETNQTGAGDVITSRSRGKLKTLYLHYQGLYGYQTWPDGNLPWWAPAHKVKWPFDHVVLWNHVTN